MKFLYYAVKPLGINQGFGSNPAYYAKFGWNGHNGIDFFAPHATPLHAPCDGDAFYTTDSHGGAGIYIRYPDNVKPEYSIILWHLCTKDDPQFKPLIPTDGSIVKVKLGQHIGFTDNSGAPYESSGDHLHFGLLPTDSTAAPLNKGNGFGGCIDPAPYFTGQFAEDIPEVDQVIQTSEQIITQITQAPITNTEKSSLLDSIKKLLIAIAAFLGFPEE